MKLPYFFTSRSKLTARIAELEDKAVTYRRTIGGYEGAYKRFINNLAPHCKDCQHIANSREVAE